MTQESRTAAGAAWLVVAAALVLLAVGWLRGRGGSSGLTPVADRGEPRQLQFPGGPGQPWSLSGERGHVVAVNLWATWCGPCREETPMLVRLSQERQAAGFRVVGVSLDEGADRAKQVTAFAQRYGVVYPLLFPPPLSQLAAGLEGIPTTMLFDREGRLAKVYVGEARERALREDVESLLRER